MSVDTTTLLQFDSFHQVIDTQVPAGRWSVSAWSGLLCRRGSGRLRELESRPVSVWSEAKNLSSGSEADAPTPESQSENSISFKSHSHTTQLEMRSVQLVSILYSTRFSRLQQGIVGKRVSDVQVVVETPCVQWRVLWRASGWSDRLKSTHADAGWSLAGPAVMS